MRRGLALLVLSAAVAAGSAGFAATADGPAAAPALGAPEAATLLSYSQARRILLDKVVKPKSLAAGDEVIAFRLAKPLRAGQRVTPYRNRGPAFTAKGPTWFFWVDDDPRAQFEHPTRYVFIDARTRRVRTVPQQWWPLVDGSAPWFDFGAYWNRRSWAFSTLEPLPAPPASRSVGDRRPAASTAECAVIIDGSGDAKAGFPDDVNQLAEVTRVNFGLDTRKLGPPTNSKEDFEKAVDELAKDGCTNMLVFIGSHGSKASVDMGKGTYTAAELKALMEKYPSVGFKVVVQSCKSGSWIEPLGNKPEIVITSTDDKTPSYSANPDGPDDPNPDDRGSEFASGLIEDLRAIPQDQTLLAEVQQCLADREPLLVCKLRIAFRSAVAKDEDAKAGKTNPRTRER